MPPGKTDVLSVLSSCARCRKMVMKRRTGIFLPIMTILSLSIRWRCTRIMPGKGVGRQLVHFVVDYGRKNGMKAVRLDVYEKNEPAIRLYQKCGFQYIDTVDLGYGKYGLDRFALFQKLL